jgi:hypothetical protein
LVSWTRSSCTQDAIFLPYLLHWCNIQFAVAGMAKFFKHA